LGDGKSSRLPSYSDPGNLVGFLDLSHTRFTYHRTWETGLEPEIRVAGFNPAFFCSKQFFSIPQAIYKHFVVFV